MVKFVLIFANEHPRVGKAKSCEWCAGQKWRCAETEEGLKKRKGMRAENKEKEGKKRKGKEVEREDMEMTEVTAEVKKLTGVVRALKGEVERLGRGYQRMRREMREWREWVNQDWVDEDFEMGLESEESGEGTEEEKEITKE